jgi:hypothetical protein
MSWRFWLLDAPAKIVSVWFALYGLLITLMVSVVVVMVLLTLALNFLGIRWGW